MTFISGGIKSRATDESVLTIILCVLPTQEILFPLVRVRNHNNTKWRIPGGGVEKGETVLTAARREPLDETGLTLPLLIPKPEWQIKKPSWKDPKKIHTQHVFIGVTDSFESFTPEALDGDDYLSNRLFTGDEVKEAVFSKSRLGGFPILEPHRELLLKGFQTNFGF